MDVKSHNNTDTVKGETKAREKEKKKWAVSENLYLQIGTVINTAQLDHEFNDPLLKRKTGLLLSRKIYRYRRI